MARFDTRISGGSGNTANGNDNTTIKWIVVDRPSTNLPSNPTFVGSCPADSLGKYVVAVEVDSTGNIISEIGRIQLPAQPGVAAALVAGGQDRNVRELTNFTIDDIRFVARCGDREATIPLRMVMDNIVIPSPAPAQPAPAAPAPAPAAPAPAPTPAPTSAPAGYDDEIAGDIHVVYRYGENGEEIIRTQRQIDFWAHALEIGLANPSDFSYRKIVEVPGRIMVVSDDHVGVQFRAEHLQQRATK